MKSLIKKVLLILIISIAFTACAKKDKGSGKGVITLKAYFQEDPADPQYKGYVETLALFEEQNPNIKINVEYGGGEAFHQKFQAMATSGTLPDIFTVYVGKRSGYITEVGKVLDLREYMDDSFKSNFISATWEAQGPNGEIYTVPPALAVTHTMYANMTILNELGLSFPKTYKELLSQVDTIRNAGYYPVSLGNKDAWPMNSWFLSVLVDRIGGKEWIIDAMNGKASFTDKPFVRALEIVDEMVKKKVFSPGLNQMSNNEADQEFYSKKSVYLIDAAWRAAAMVNILSEEEQANVFMGVFPALEGEVHKNTSAMVPSEGYGINSALKGTEKADAAWKYIKFFNEANGAELRTKYGGITSYKLDISDLEIPDLQKRYSEFVANTEYGYVIDAKLDGEGMVDLNRNIQAMTLGNMSPIEVATAYEKWVAENETARQK